MFISNLFDQINIFCNSSTKSEFFQPMQLLDQSCFKEWSNCDTYKSKRSSVECEVNLATMNTASLVLIFDSLSPLSSNSQCAFVCIQTTVIWIRNYNHSELAAESIEI